MDMHKTGSESGATGASQLDEAEADGLEKRSRFSLYSGGGLHLHASGHVM